MQLFKYLDAKVILKYVVLMIIMLLKELKRKKLICYIKILEVIMLLQHLLILQGNTF
jgi:hypothetical protein